MNSRERVLAATERRRPDRPATSLRCTPEVWDALQQYLGVETIDDVMDALDIDLRFISVPFIGPAERSAIPLGSEGTDYWGCHNKKITNDFNTYFDFYDFPLAECQTPEDIDKHSWPQLDWWDYAAIPRMIAEANKKEPRSLLFFAGGAFETPWYLRGMERFMMDLYEYPEIVDSICTHAETYYYQRALRALEFAEGKIDVIGSGGDIGGERGMLLGPDTWREHIKPHSAGLMTTFKEMGYKTFYHSCGSLVPVIDDFIEMGLDILEPIQVTAAGMTPEELFPQFGDRISFHGAIDEVSLLPHATPKQVYAETTRIIDILGEHGGFIVAPSHQVQGDTPVENVIAIYDAVRDYRW